MRKRGSTTHPLWIATLVSAGLLALQGHSGVAFAQELAHNLHSPAPDSARTLSSARSAQARFERIRRNHLPWTHDRGGGPCDERIGRFCLWYGPKDTKWEPPPEPEPVQQARQELITRLGDAAGSFPGDAWVAGQRVRYLVEAGSHAEALAAADECRSETGWWCGALAGYALHAASEFEKADSAFAAALQEMPPTERRRWRDVSTLLDARGQREYRRLDDDQRDAWEERFWWLANPLYLLPGNDRRTEHYSRHVLDRLQDRARSTEGISWGSDLRELLVRYGWPAGWERIRPRTPSMETQGMVTRYPRGSRQFIPPSAFVKDPAAISADDWPLDDDQARSGYAPAYSPAFAELEHQIAVFLRGDSAQVVTALDVSRDTLFGESPLGAGLILLRDEHLPPTLSQAAVENGTARFSMRVDAVPTLLSLEAVAEDRSHAARARYGLRLAGIPAHGLALSDVLLLEHADSLPSSLEDAVPIARGTNRVKSGERVGLYWEVYGVGPRESVSLSLDLMDENRGALRRLAERIGLVRQIHPIRVGWQESPSSAEAVLPRALELEIPELSPGSYRLRLTITVPGREPLQTSRVLRVEG